MTTKTMTFGIMPSREDFAIAWSAMCAEDGNDPDSYVFEIRQASGGNAGAAWHGDYTRDELYDRVAEEVARFDAGETDFDDDECITSANDVLGIVGIEWI